MTSAFTDDMLKYLTMKCFSFHLLSIYAFLRCILGEKETNPNLGRVYYKYVLGLATGPKLYRQICS